MAIIVPYVTGGLTRETKAWGEANGARFVHLPTSEDDAYYRLLVEEWTRPGPLLIVEEDNVPTVPVRELLHCPRPWCLCPYKTHYTTLDHSLGVVCFSSSLKRRYPDLMIQAGSDISDREPPHVWWRMDLRIARWLARCQVEPHYHAEALHRGHGVIGARNA